MCVMKSLHVIHTYYTCHTYIEYIHTYIATFEESGKLENLKKSPKTGDRFKATSDLENNEERDQL